MAVITSAGTGDSNTGGTWTGGVVPDATSDVQILNTHTITLDTTHTWNSLDLQSGGTLDGDGNELTIDGEDGGGHAVELNGAISGTDTDITATTAATSKMDLIPSSGSIRNLTINASGNINQWIGNTTISGDLIVTAGTIQPYSAGNTLTVTGDVSIASGGTLGGNSGSGAMSMGSLTIADGGTYSATSGTTTIDKEHSGGFAWKNEETDGTAFVHNDGTVLFASTFDTHIQESSFYNLTLNGNADARQIIWRDATGNLLTIANDLTVTRGVFFRNTVTDTLTVTRDVSVGATGTMGDGGESGANNFGSLTIASGGTYVATSGTTTLTDGGANGDANQALYGEGTFTHNNGTLTFNGSKKRIPNGATFYNVTVNGEIDTDGIFAYTSTLLPQGIMPDGTTGINYFSVLGTLQINNDEFRPYNADKIYVHNLIIGDGTGSANSAKFDMSEADTFNGTVFVDNVTINSDGQLLFGDAHETSATVGSSALNIYGAFRNLGGSVDIV